MSGKGVLVLAAMMLSVLTASHGGAQEIVPPEVSESSEIVVDMVGAVTATLRIVVEEGQTTVVLEKDGEVETAAMSEHDCMGLWEYCLRRGATSLTSTRPARIYPDSAVFDVTFRIADETHRFVVEGVDQLQDTRYRELIREILAVCSRYVSSLEGP